MKDLLHKFKQYFTAAPDYWKLTGTGGQGRYAISYYPLSFRDRLYQGHYVHFDAGGLPMFHSKAGELVHFCTGMCSFAFAHWEEFLNNGNQEHADQVIKVADYLIDMAETRINGSMMILDYDSDARDNGLTCAMNQGESISVVCRAYCLTQDRKYLESALKMAIPFRFPYGHDGVKGKLENNATWYLEGGKMILNGHNYSLFGLADLVRISNEQWVKDLFDVGVKSVEDSVQYFDNGFWTWYWLDKPLYIASAMYHNLHICQLEVLARVSGSDKISSYAKRFARYAGSPVNRARAAALMVKAKLKKKLA